ncbi:phosphoglycerate mutase [Oleiagrimonas sp. C23AA]|uniref:phosphoglycerate mutase n=1 Tax=Oleiagrimonas sp. C23AA TaxID=2719047 RepID=UPI0014247A42|nr:phosphoglycerate mutase [Oleiagrimonas sp. C23AA]NII10426.1 phosphoglycerate mutase [Oleiagrimonas sp. C23AA]
MSMLHVLLPSTQRTGALTDAMPWLLRGDHLPDAEAGYHAALRGFFRTPAGSWPVAALTRDALYGDAEGSTWLGADLAFVQPDLTGARLLACGHLDISREESAALAAELAPSFGDRGFVLEPSLPSRWHLRLPRGAQPPHFDDPEQVLGDDLLEHLPQGGDGRRWRALLTETQVLLHQSDINAQRQQRGQAPANSLWFWGGGALPAWVKSELGLAISDEPVVRALATRSHVAHQVLPQFDAATLKAHAQVLLDLEREADLTRWWPQLEALWREGHSLMLHATSGERWQLKPGHRWRLWRRGR